MATTTWRKRRREFGGAWGKPLEGDEPAPENPTPHRRLARWGWPAGVLVVFLVLVWLLPTMVARSPLLNWIVGSVAADLKGKITARSASLGWFTFPRLSGIEIRDEQGQPVLDIAEIRTDRSLLAILWDWSNLGQIRLQRPALHLVLRQDGSNVEDVLASYLASDEPPDSLGLGLEIVDGKVSIHDPRTGDTWQIQGFQLVLSKPADPTKPLALQTSGAFADQQHPGRFAVTLKMHQGATLDGPIAIDPPSNDTRPRRADELVIKTENVPLAMFQAIIDRFGLEVESAGRLSSDLLCRWNDPAAPGTMVIQGRATAADLQLTSSSLGSDQLGLERLEATCQVAWQDDRIQVEQLVVQCDVGNAYLSGTFELGDIEAENMLRRLSGQTCELEAQVDLARLAALVPHTLRIREGTQVTSGKLRVALASRHGPDGRNWHGRIAASNLAAVNQGRRLVWQQPILITLAAQQSAQGPIAASLHCDSDFLTLDAEGTPEQLSASARFDLNRLAGQLGEFVELGELRLAGDGSARFDWKRSDQHDFEAEAKLEVRDLALALPDRPPWTEENLTATLLATGRTDFTADTQVGTATLTIHAGPDRLVVRLTEPVLDFRSGGVWPVEVYATGQLARVPPRVGPWIALGNWHLAGSYELMVQATGSAAAIRVRQGRLAVRDLRLQGRGLDVRQPQAELIVSGSWRSDRRRLKLPSANLTAGSVAVQATGIVCTFPPDGLPELAGTVTYRGSLDRLREWAIRSPGPSPWHVQGDFSGKAELRHTGGTTAATFETTINDLVATHQSGRQFHEPQVRLEGQGTYDAQGRVVRLDQAHLTCGTMGLRAAGQLALKEGQPDLQLAGQLDYDLEKLSKLVSTYLGEGVRFTGSGSRPLSYQGPLALDAAHARAGLSWTRGDVYGFLMGPGELVAELSGGVLQVQPFDLAVSEGHVRLASQVRLAPEPRELHIQPGRVADQVRINPRMCAHLLQYIAPVLAGVATAEGRFSIELDGCRIPLADPAQGDLGGRLVVHSVRIGPGPLIHELAVLRGRATPAQLTRESVISFRMVDGRVYHRDLELVFPDLTIRTYGSVGLDGSLAIMAEMPVPPKWRPKHELVDSVFRDQLLRIPIGGTLNRPRIDRKTLDSLSRQFLQNAARNVLEDGLNRGLERLFGPAPEIR